MSQTIKSGSNLTLTAPSISFSTSNLVIPTSPTVNNANTNILSRNTVSGKFEIIDSSVTSFGITINNVGGFNTLVQTPGFSNTHSIKSVQSSTGSVNIISNATNLDLRSNITLNNLLPNYNILATSGSGYNFNFKSVLESTGITIADNPNDLTVELKPMDPEQIGGIFGAQNKEDNFIGFDNRVTLGTKSNIIGSKLPSALIGEASNIISSYSNLSTANGTFTRSNILLSGSDSEINTSRDSHIMACNFSGSGVDMNNSIYIGDFINTRPSDISMCINSNLHGNSIRMAKESVYLGTGQTTLSLSPGECHMDFRCPAWFYHDLNSGATSNVLYYDTSSSQITYGAVEVTLSNSGASGSLILLNPGTGSGPFNFATLQTASDGLDVINNSDVYNLRTHTCINSCVVGPSVNINIPTRTTVTINNLTASTATIGLGAYNDGIINLGTGVIDISVAASVIYKVQFCLNILYQDSNALVLPSFMTLQLYDSVTAAVVRQKTFYINNAQQNSYTFDGLLKIPSSTNVSFTFRILHTSLVGTQTIYAGLNSNLNWLRVA